jgi:hypothetical protein
MRFIARSKRSCSAPAAWVPPRLVVALLGTIGAVGAVGCQAATASSVSDAGSGALDGGEVASTSTCPASTGAVDPTALIDNFEHGSSSLLPFIAGRVGGWYALGDGTPSALLQPSGPVSPEVIPAGGHCGSRYALHLTGAGFLDWGAQVITPLYYGPGDAGVPGFLPYDVSQYHGVTFSARLGDTSSADVRFAIGDARSRPEGGMCTLGGTFGNGCYDNFGVDLAPFLGVEWREFHIPFTGLGQRNIGLHADALDRSRVYDLEFDFAPSVIFDLWVDDVSFY